MIKVKNNAACGENEYRMDISTLDTPSIKQTISEMNDVTYLSDKRLLICNEFLNGTLNPLERLNLLRHWIANGVKLYFLSVTTSEVRWIRMPFLTIGECNLVLNDLEEQGQEPIKITIYPIDELNQIYVSSTGEHFTNWDYQFGGIYAQVPNYVYEGLSEDHLATFLPNETRKLLSRPPTQSM